MAFQDYVEEEKPLEARFLGGKQIPKGEFGIIRVSG